MCFEFSSINLSMKTQAISKLDIGLFVALVALYLAWIFPYSVLAPLNGIVALAWILFIPFMLILRFGSSLLSLKSYYGVPSAVKEYRQNWQPGVKTLQIGREEFVVAHKPGTKPTIFTLGGFFIALGVLMLVAAGEAGVVPAIIFFTFAFIAIVAILLTGKASIVADIDGLTFIVRGKSKRVLWNDIVALDEITHVGGTTYRVYTKDGRETYDDRYSDLGRLNQLVQVALETPRR